jgi:uncharacterized SAM-binding protein YcdF (DUF218 family)
MTVPMTRLRRAVLASAVVVALGYLGCFIAVYHASRQDQRSPADVIVVLGAAQYNGKPSPVLRARLDHAVDLYGAHLAPIVIVTGGIGEGDRTSEAAVGQEYLVSHGVREADVVPRPEGRSTDASIASVSVWLHDRHLQRALLVSDPFHSLRLRLEARRAHIQACTSPTTTSPISLRFTTELPFLLAEAAKIPVVWLRTIL